MLFHVAKTINQSSRFLYLIVFTISLTDKYLQNPANELKSMLALKLKKKILIALLEKDFAHDNPEKQAELLAKYKDYLMPV